MQVKLIGGGGVPWQPNEIVTVQVTSIEEDGSYVCETLETFPADLKARHAAEVDQLQQKLNAVVAAPAPVESPEVLAIASKPAQTGLPQADVNA